MFLEVWAGWLEAGCVGPRSPGAEAPRGMAEGLVAGLSVSGVQCSLLHSRMGSGLEPCYSQPGQKGDSWVGAGTEGHASVV